MVVLVVGPRQAGKTTLARLYATRDRPYLTLDDPATLAAARSDPAGFVRGLKQAVIDEVQRAQTCCWPSRKVWTKIKRRVVSC
ncbi:AAA family ATPase [Polaromonas sp. P1(28)-13]|nr:AAA family ATPase [Polaromonas sp. P1(28)-13]